MREALHVRLGKDATGVSANVVSKRRGLMNTRNGAVGIGRTRGTCRGGDGLHPGLRSEQSEGPGRRVILGVTPEGRNERVVIGDGYRESKESWKDT